LLSEKNLADYGVRRPTRDEASTTVGRAEAFYTWGKRQVELAYNLKKVERSEKTEGFEI
jgi:hypothetical protein